jgi:hypothetical protein
LDKGSSIMAKHTAGGIALLLLLLLEAAYGCM